MERKKPFVLVILDGWGYRKEETHNAIALANTPQWDHWWATRPHMLLNASGKAVGLPDEQMGNSEVGHMHIGAGRLIPQDFSRINDAIEHGEFKKNPLLLQLISDLKEKKKRLHVMGLLSDGGVHSHENHLFAFLALCHQEEFYDVCLHLFLDGRDTPPQSALTHLKKLNHVLLKHPVGQVSSITGRYFAMDRDKRWDRIAPMYRLLTEGDAPFQFETPEEAIKAFYAQKIHDEFIPPTLIGHSQPIENQDAIFFFNFRADRTRQLTDAFLNPSFDGFERAHQPHLDHFVTMTRYTKAYPTEHVFPPLCLQNTLGEVIAKAHLSQLRVAETEKYAHVTYFLNGGSERVFDNEDRILIPSPKMATYDLCPDMSALALTRELANAIENQAYDVIICNYANADMVGHTGNFTATLKAIECLDQCMHRVWQAVSERQGMMLITADHGNAECMFNEAIAQKHTAHTSQPVPLLFLGDGWHFIREEGHLIDVAPTVLTLLGIAPPNDMTGDALLAPNP